MELALLSEKQPMLQQLYPIKVQQEQAAVQQLWPVSANRQVWRE